MLQMELVKYYGRYGLTLLIINFITFMGIPSDFDIGMEVIIITGFIHALLIINSYFTKNNFEFVNALPVKREKQYYTIYFTGIAYMFVSYGMFLFSIYLQEGHLDFRPVEIVIFYFSGVALLTVAYSFFVWVLMHTRRILSAVIAFLALVIIYCTVFSQYIGVMFAYSINGQDLVNFVKLLWFKLTVPEKLMNAADKSIVTDAVRLQVFFCVTGICLIISAVLFLLGKRLAKNIDESNLNNDKNRHFNRVFKVILVLTISVCLSLLMDGRCVFVISDNDVCYGDGRSAALDNVVGKYETYNEKGIYSVEEYYEFYECQEQELVRKYLIERILMGVMAGIVINVVLAVVEKKVGERNERIHKVQNKK